MTIRCFIVVIIIILNAIKDDEEKQLLSEAAVCCCFRPNRFLNSQIRIVLMTNIMYDNSTNGGANTETEEIISFH